MPLVISSDDRVADKIRDAKLQLGELVDEVILGSRKMKKKSNGVRDDSEVFL